MVKTLYDTNILIDLLNGIPMARSELEQPAFKAISIITWMEVMAGATEDEQQTIADWLAEFEVIDVNPAIADEAVRIRKVRRIKLPDAIIWATARVSCAVLVTRNVKDFPAVARNVRVPYRL